MDFDLKKCIPECVECIKRYAKKHNLGKGDKFDISCKGIPKEYISEDVLAQLSGEARKMALCLLDPVSWAKEVLDWHCVDEDGEVWKTKNYQEYKSWMDKHPESRSMYHRPQQATLLRCSASNKVLRIGRQFGKCLVSGTMIQMADGTQKKIEDIKDRDLVLSVDDDYRIVSNQAFRACNGEKNTLKIQLSDGKEIEATPNHPFLVYRKDQDQWIEAQHLSINDSLAVPKEFCSNLCMYERNEVAFVKIKSISEAGKQMTWDLTVPKTHNFIANNIVTHNTQTLTILALFRATTIENYRVVVIAPDQKQIDVIYDLLLDHIENSVDLSNSKKSSAKSPHRKIEFHNSSRISLFSAGTKSGNGASGIRGQKADLLILDESDYLAPADVESVMALITNSPNAKVWMSSTPTGKRQKFYNTCFNPRYKEFHYPSSINPMWTEELERDFRFQLGEAAYEHEAEANFGEQEQGVFQNVYVQKAQSDYRYEQCKKYNHWFYMVGVDWNDAKNGTTIAITGFNPANNTFTRVGSENISRIGWTQTAAMEKIVEINRAWAPISIYVDNGYGHTQIEMLRMFGYTSMKDPNKGKSHPDTRLKDIIKPFDFGSKIEMKDPLTDLLIKKDAKPFLVQSAARRFERGDFIYSKYDTILTDQLLAYVIDRQTQSGRPIYKTNNDSIGDHELDAMMLSLVGFVLESSMFSIKDQTVSGIAKTGNFGENIQKESAKPPAERNSSDKKIEKTESRTELFSKPASIGSMPAARTQRSAKKLWSWPGFSRDEPAPVRSNRGGSVFTPTRQRPRRSNV